MRTFIKYCLVMLLAFTFVSPALADQAADDKVVADSAAISAVMARVDSGELSVDQALVLALEQDISFSAIVAACESRNIPLSSIITAAASVGMSSEVALAKMAAANVSSEDMSIAIAAADDNDTGLGYTKDKTKKPKKPKKVKKDDDDTPVSPSQLN